MSQQVVTQISAEEMIKALEETKFLLPEKKEELIGRIQESGVDESMAAELSEVFENEISKIDAFIAQKKAEYVEQEKAKHKEIAEIQPALQQLWKDTTTEMQAAYKEYQVHLAKLDKELETVVKQVAVGQEKEEIDDIRKNLGLK